MGFEANVAPPKKTMEQHHIMSTMHYLLPEAIVPLLPV